MFPAVVLLQTQTDLYKRTPLGPLRFADEMQAGFLWRAVGFMRIALNTGANNVFPRGRAAAVTWDNVIEIEILAIKYFTAILAGVLVALENIMAGELNFLFRQMIKNTKENHARNADAK